MAKRPKIEVVVVARDASAALATCLASLRAHGGYRRLVVADAASSRERIREAAAHGDVAVVPADAVVTPGWLDKLSACVTSAPGIATATPLTTQSIPLAAHADAAAVAAAAERAAVPLYPQIPAPGPVALWRGGALADGGSRHVLCDTAYVATTSGPAGTSGLAPIAAMLRAQLGLALRAGSPGVLHVVHPRGGGTEKFIRELIAARGDYRHYFLRVYDDCWRVVEAGDTGSAFELARGGGGSRPGWLRDLCSWLRVGLVHVHSMVGSGDDLVRMIASTGLPYCYSVHDMYLPCPTVYLIGADGEYCNATTDPAACRRCLQGLGVADDIETWRARYAPFLAGAARVYAPSRWAGDTLQRYYPRSAVAVAPPQEAPPLAGAIENPAQVFALPDDGVRPIGILGAIGPEKGARKIEALSARIRERSLPLRLVVVGYTDTLSRFQSDDAVLTVHGGYARGEIEPLLDAYAIALLLFPTVWPETFSYTLSEGWMAGRPALVPPRGALAERVAATGAGWLIEKWPDLDALLDQLVSLTAPESRAELARRTALARAAFHGQQRMRAADPYADLLDEPRPLGDVQSSRYAIYESACRALGVAPEPRPPAVKAQTAHGVQRLMRMLTG